MKKNDPSSEIQLTLAPEPAPAPTDAEAQSGEAKVRIIDPFGKFVNSGEMFRHQQATELQDTIKTAIRQQQPAVVWGPPGVGKTTCLRCTTDELPINKFTVVYLGQDQHGTNLLRRFAEALGIQPKRARSQMIMQISKWLADNLKDGGKQIILVVDEAQGVDDQTLEDLRLLSNTNYDRQSPFTLILLAQPGLRSRLKAPFLEPLWQRLRWKYSLEGLGRDETFQYIQFRLSSAGLPPNLFTEDALHQLFLNSEGVPRRLNNIASLVLRKARTAKLLSIDAAFVKAVTEAQDN